MNIVTAFTICEMSKIKKGNVCVHYIIGCKVMYSNVSGWSTPAFLKLVSAELLGSAEACQVSRDTLMRNDGRVMAVINLHV